MKKERKKLMNIYICIARDGWTGKDRTRQHWISKDIARTEN